MPDPVSLKCPNCGSVLRAEDYDMTTGIIRCSYCKALATLPGPGAAAVSVPFHPRQEIPMPPRITCQDDGTNMVITRRWRSAIVFFLIPFCIAWDSFLIFWYGMAFSGNAPWIMIIFPVGHVAVGVGLTYFALATMFNRTVIMAGQGSLRISSGPVPWGRNIDMSSSDIDQIFCKAKTRRNDNDSSPAYEVWALLHNGSTLRLLGSDADQDQALFIEQKLNKAFGIRRRPVPGEF
ncbi:MAG: hypothetical protein WCN98_21250, partial [Verrucomicrobiaceae bacterium]